MDSYIGFLTCVIIGCIAFAILILSLVFEMIEKSKVPKSYYLTMVNLTIAPFITLMLFSLFISGSFDWTKD